MAQFRFEKTVLNFTISNNDYDISTSNTPTEFSCGYEDYEDVLGPSAVTPAVTLAVLLILVILVGNGIIITAVVKYPKLRTAQNIFFCSLSISDFALAITVLPCSVLREKLGYWPLGSFLCKVYLAIDIFLCTASIWNLCLISINRYFAFTMGIRYRRMCSHKRIFGMVAVGWIWSGVVSIPGFIFSKSLSDEGDPTVCSHSNEMWYILYSVSGSFYVPLVIMMVAYGRISWLLKKMADNSQIREVTLQRQKRIQTMTGIVLGAFIVCWFPFFQTYVITSFCATCCVPPLLFKFLEWFAYCNSAVNPFIYSLTKSDLRQHVNILLRNRGTVLLELERAGQNQGPGQVPVDEEEHLNSDELREMQSFSRRQAMVKLPRIAWSSDGSNALSRGGSSSVRNNFGSLRKMKLLRKYKLKENSSHEGSNEKSESENFQENKKGNKPDPAEAKSMKATSPLSLIFEERDKTESFISRYPHEKTSVFTISGIPGMAENGGLSNFGRNDSEQLTKVTALSEDVKPEQTTENETQNQDNLSFSDQQTTKM